MKTSKNSMDDELRPEYDLGLLLKGGVRGKYAKRYHAGTNLALLDPDVRKAFRSERGVNDALTLVLVGEGFAVPREPRGLPYPPLTERPYSAPCWRPRTAGWTEGLGYNRPALRALAHISGGVVEGLLSLACGCRMNGTGSSSRR